jgi:hypothetical protein
MTTLPPPLPKPASQQLPLSGKITLIIATGLLFVGFFLSPENPPTTATTATTTTSSDPCGWAKRPSGVTREACERMGAVQHRLWQEEELERNPNYKPYAITPNR